MDYKGIDEIISGYMPYYVFYKKRGRKTDCYCTACHKRYTDDPDGRTYGMQSNYKHKAFGVCTSCGEDVQYRAWGRGRSSERHKRNFALFEAMNEGTVEISCFTATQYFEDDNMEPEIDMNEKARYLLTRDEAIQYRKEYEYIQDDSTHHHIICNWIRKKSEPSEPIFNSGFSGYYVDNSYTVINDECLMNTFLKYSVTGLPETICHHFITYLCMVAKRPNIEYLMKGGFFDLAMDIVSRTATGVRINWKSNNLLKMLHIDRTEVKFLYNKGRSFYSSYLIFRSQTYKGKTSSETIHYFELFNYCAGRLQEAHKRANISVKQMMDYIIKQASSCKHDIIFTTLSYNDYLNECETLKYDFNDPAVVLPSKLWAAHDRTSRIVKIKNDKEAAKRLRETNKFREQLVYADYNAGLITRIPKSVGEIVKEGKVLSHCVGGYADRHANGKLHIIFLRKISEPKTPYYTIEVSLEGKIIQCRGYKNNVIGKGGSEKPQEIIDFEAKYQEYLDTIYNKKKNKKVGKSA